MEQASEGLHGADVGKQSQFLAHSQQALFGTYLGSRVVIKFRVAYGREKHCICLLASFVGGFGKRVAYFVDRICTADSIFIIHFVSEFLTNSRHYVYTYGRNLRADTVTGQYCNFKVHLLSYLSICLFFLYSLDSFF